MSAAKQGKVGRALHITLCATRFQSRWLTLRQVLSVPSESEESAMSTR
jgi:hypothetical protein